jgi:Ca2+-binding EF-hand superfamily protein
MNKRLLRYAVVSTIVGASTLALAAQADERTAGTSGHAEVQMMDANQDGVVSPDEHAAGARKMFEKMDADHDGKVTAAEMDATHHAMHKGDDHSNGEMSSADKIKTIDTDGDGILSAQEHEAGSHRMFEKMDADHDGNLSASEIDAGHKTMMKKTN